MISSKEAELYKTLLSHMKVGEEISTFNQIEIEKSSVPVRNVDIEKILVSKKISSREKDYFIDYLHNDHQVKALDKMLPNTTAYIKSYNGRTK